MMSIRNYKKDENNALHSFSEKIPHEVYCDRWKEKILDVSRQWNRDISLTELITKKLFDHQEIISVENMKVYTIWHGA